MTVLGISASGRENGITSEVVNAVLEATGEPYEYISLTGLQIGGCRGCTRCAADSRCKVEDDWLAIGEKMLAAEAMTSGAPKTYGMINALGHACWERTFCFRHREVFRLAGKLGVAIGVGYEAENLRGGTLDPIDLPSGCRLHPRCPESVPICSEQTPNPKTLAEEHQAACLLLCEGREQARRCGRHDRASNVLKKGG